MHWNTQTTGRYCSTMLCLWIKIFISVLLVYNQGTEACPTGYTKHGAFCYFFSEIHGSWAQAMQYCEIFGGKLAVIESETEQLFLESFLNNTWNKNFINQTSKIWLGGSDLLVENEWSWVKPIKPMSYTRWGPGEPNQWHGRSEDCLSMNAAEVFRWDDSPCETHYNFICQAEETQNSFIIGK